MENKIKTSIQYQLSNVLLFDKVYGHWKEFDQQLAKGPSSMKKYLCEEWNNIKEIMKQNEMLEIADLDKEVTEDDFDVTYNETATGVSIFFISLTKYEYRDAASQYIALALTPKAPRFFTFECSEHAANHEPCWVIGEFAIRENKKAHRNLGITEKNDIAWFAGYVTGLLEQEAKENN